MNVKQLLKTILSMLLMAGMAMSAHAADVITFTWKGSTEPKRLHLSASTYENFTIDWGNGKSEPYEGYGNAETYTQSEAYGNEGEYTVTITADPNCQLLELHFLGGNEVVALDVSQARSLSVLDCYNNKLTKLNLSANSALNKLNCSWNTLTSLNLSDNTELTDLDCFGNSLSELNLSDNTKLTDLNCGNNQLNDLDVTANTSLTSLNCFDNKLTSLDISKNIQLKSFDCAGNQLPLSTLYAISTVLDAAKATRISLDRQQPGEFHIAKNVSFDLSGEMNLGGTQSDISVKINGSSAVPGEDYELDYTNENITFLRTASNIEVNLTHTDIHSTLGDKNYVLLTFDVYDYSTDAELLSIDSPTSAAGMSNAEVVTVSIANNGYKPLSDFILRLTVNGTTYPDEIFGGRIDRNSYDMYAFSQTVDMSEPGDYTIKVEVIVEDDENPANNVCEKIVKHVACEDITVFPWTESFDNSGSYLCWTIIDVDQSISDNATWEYDEVSGSMLHSYGWGDTQEGWLITPQVKLPASGTYLLTFMSHIWDSDYYVKNSVLVSTTGKDPADFTEIWTPAKEDIKDDWVETVLNLAAYAGKDIYIAFKYEGDDAHEWVLDDVKIALDPATGIATTEQDNIKLYPNPAKESVTLSGLGENATITISDLSGKTIRTYNASNELTITIDFASGVYLVKVNDAVQKLIVR